MYKGIGFKKPFKVEYKKLAENAIEPKRGSSEAAGWDLFSDAAYDIAPHSTVKVHTNIALAIPKGAFGAIYARSGIALKKGLRPANCVGIIDSDYRGEIIVALHNDTDELMSIEGGTRVAQLIVQPYLPICLEEVEDLDETDRGGNGFGSTGEH